MPSALDCLKLYRWIGLVCLSKYNGFSIENVINCKYINACYCCHFLDEQDIDFLMIIHTAAASFYVPFNLTCSYVLQLKTPFIYFTNIYLYQFFYHYSLSLL